jgi:hypothetical protein
MWKRFRVPYIRYNRHGRIQPGKNAPISQWEMLAILLSCLE